MKYKIIIYFLSLFFLTNVVLAETPSFSNLQHLNQLQSNVNRLNERILSRDQPSAMQSDESGFHRQKTLQQKADADIVAEKPLVVLKKIQLKGMTAFPLEQLEKIYKPFYGKKITFSQLRSIVDTLTYVYNQKGYFLSQAILPPQNILNGVVTIQIIEGYIGSVDVQGKVKANTKIFIQDYARCVCGIKPIQEVMLEQLSKGLNRYPGIRTQFLLHKGLLPLTRPRILSNIFQ